MGKNGDWAGRHLRDACHHTRSGSYAVDLQKGSEQKRVLQVGWRHLPWHLQKEAEDDGLQAAVQQAPGLHTLQLLEKEEAVHLVRRVHAAVQQQAGKEVFILEEGRTCTGLMVFTR